jgi:Flp pilus assembly protein TadD
MTDRLLISYLPAILSLLPSLCPAWQQAPSPEMRDALSALERSDFAAAERRLRAEIAVHPGDSHALSLLGAALDSQRKTSEADTFHRRAVARSPRSAEVLNNYAAHLWLAGREQEAGKVYRRLVALDPSHYNANLQLARLAIKARDGAQALQCLDRLPAAQRENPMVLLPRLEALYLSGDRAQADALAARLREMARSDRNLAFAAGISLSNAEQFAQAEAVFEIALQGDPANFNVLYDLGIAATRAGHLDRARQVLDAALRQQPRNVDVLYALASADHASKQWESALQLLSQAARLDPRRADVQRMLAVAATDVGALDDASAAWDRYLKLKPDDAVARRERGYTAAQKGQIEEGLVDLEWFAARHPDDAVGHYELGQAQRSLDMAGALAHFDRALELDPRYVPARTARGSLYFQQGKPEAALPDLETAAQLRADDAASLDRLGQTYQALDRTADAIRVLRRAAELAPNDSKTLLHFARALADAGELAESKTVMDRFRQLGPEKKTGVRAGFVEYLSLTDVERRAEYRARLEKALRAHPDDPALQVDYLKLLLQDGNSTGAEAVAHTIAGMKPAAAVLADAGRALLAARQYGLASNLLKQAQAAGAPPGIELDLAVASGNLDEVLQGLEQRPDLYPRAAALLVEKGRIADALELLNRAARARPNDREILLLQAAAAELAGNTADAERALSHIQSRWPEWPPGWATHAVILAIHSHAEDARKARETAVALGAPAPELAPRYLLTLFR